MIKHPVARGLEVVIETNKRTYHVGEDIQIRVGIKNVGATTVRVAEECPWYSTTLFVSSDSGVGIDPKYGVNGTSIIDPKMFEIASGSLTYLQCDGTEWSSLSHWGLVLSQPGSYVIEGTPRMLGGFIDGTTFMPDAKMRLSNKVAIQVVGVSQFLPGLDEYEKVQALVASGKIAEAKGFWYDQTGWSPKLGPSLYDPGDSLFAQQKYRAAFAAYLETFFGDRSSQSHVVLRPESTESGARDSLRQALALAAEASYPMAESLLVTATEKDPDFGEGQYLLANMYWAHGEPSRAVSVWKTAVADFGYTQPPTGWRPPRASAAALDMLFIHCAQVGSCPPLAGTTPADPGNKPPKSADISGQRGLALSAELVQQTAKIGDPIQITLTIKDDGSSMGIFRWGSIAEYDLHGKGPDGVPIEKFDRQLTFENSGRLGFTVGDGVVYTQKFDNLAEQYDFSKPGRYTFYFTTAVRLPENINTIYATLTSNAVSLSIR